MAWADKRFTIPYTIKKINGDHYYKWRDLVKAGTVFLANTDGVGSNLMNPSPYKHGAIYYGKGLKSAVDNLIDELNTQFENTQDSKIADKIDRLILFMLKNEIQDDICYVIEAVGKGVIATNLVKFMTTKDKLLIIEPTFTDEWGMKLAANNAIGDLGLPYDFGFHHDNTSKYCFEVVADAYEATRNDIKIHRKEWHLWGKKIFDAFLGESFLDEQWKIIVDSDKM
jgi:hypothetical protein